MIERLFGSFTKFRVWLLMMGIVLYIVLIAGGEFPSILFPAHDYEYVLENGLKSGDHIKGEIFFSVGSFGSKESYTQYETYRTASETDGYYYMIPAGDGGMAGLYVYKDDLEIMEQLTEETYNYLMGGSVPHTTIYFHGVAKTMDRELEGLEDAFREQLEYMEYTESEIEEMLAAYTNGECLVLSGPKEMRDMYIMLATGTILIIWALILIIRDFIEETRYEKMRANGMAGQPRQPQVMGTSGNTTYYNGYDAQNGYNTQNGYNAQNGYNTQNGYNAQNGYNSPNGCDTPNGGYDQNNYNNYNNYDGQR